MLRAGAQRADGSDRARVRAASVSPADCSDHAGARRSLLKPRARWAGRKIEQRGAGQPQWEVVVERTREEQCARGAAREA